MKKEYPLFSKIIFKDYDLIIPFVCQKTGKRCKTFMPHISDNDLEEIACYLHKKGEDIHNQYKECSKMKHTATPLPCIFFNKETTECTIYPLRPNCCRLYPFSFGGGDLNCTGYREHLRLVETMVAGSSDYTIYDSSFHSHEDPRSVPLGKWKKLLRKFTDAKPSASMIQAFIDLNHIPRAIYEENEAITHSA
jgi:Fe-S-cluster containining protein